jgi:ferric-dicitrate binding protein FerR (iron transport regulator)
MNTNSLPRKRSASELLLAYLDDDLDESGLAELNAGLETDPDFRREAALLMIQEQHFHRLASRSTAIAPARRGVAGLGQILTGWIGQLRDAFRPHRLAWALGSAAVAAVTLVLAYSYLGAPAGPRLAAVTGEAKIQRGAALQAARIGLQLQPGDVLLLATNASVELAYARESTSLRFWAGAQASLGSSTSGKRFTLERGALFAMVARQSPGAPLRLSTPHGQVMVVGTGFSLEVDSQQTRLEVWEGKVRLSDRLETNSLDVAAGEFGIANNLEPLQRGSIRQGGRRECWLQEANPGVRPLDELPCFARQPAFHEFLGDFMAPQNWNDFYASRIRALLRPRASGLYQFWVSGDDRAELWLSRDDLPEHKVRICASPEWAGPEEWDKSVAQQSALIRLEAGRKYYIEALHYEEAGGDSVAVAWRPPGSERDIIRASYLTPFPAEPAEVSTAVTNTPSRR